MLRAVGKTPIARERLHCFILLTDDPYVPIQQIPFTILTLENNDNNCSLFLKTMQIPAKKRLHWSVDSPRILQLLQ